MHCHRHHDCSPPPQHHHRRANNSSHHHPSSSSCCCCCSKSANCAVSSNLSSSDHHHHHQQHHAQLLQALLLLQSHNLTHSPPPKPPAFLDPTKSCTTNRRGRHRHHHPTQDDDDESHDPSILLLPCLIRRISALESSVSSFSPPQRYHRSLKDEAAAVIQRCFRRFLARRSRTLRDLKLLASIKSHAAFLRSSLADRSLKNPQALSEKAMHLLFQLDSIQSSDPMIREGKRSTSKELVRISEFIDKILIREKEDDEVDELEGRIRRDGARRVSFAATKGEDECKLFDDLPERILELKEVEETHLMRDKVGSDDDCSDYGEESPGFQGSKGRLAAPLPVKMEPRRSGSMKKMNEDD